MSDKQIQINDTEIVNDLLLIQWSDKTDSAIPLTLLRDNCPCASCAGEKDALGNIHVGPPQQMTQQRYQLRGVQPVGYYGLRPFWADGHSTGIYTHDLLKKLAADN
ncbi:MAG: DUF971 domain-containing protein [Candidatus Marinimicrobia bacterium]|nr:DUF971 domain-containing protein [Candidatus Neomarinimicrobiota bacterium]MCH7764829.1 DUF971 domain-containing protein [Candidatus Neomarinimicrobiota bacterium]